MSKDQALKILIQVAHMAQKAGVLSLSEAPTVAAAVQVLSVTEKQDEKSKESCSEGCKEDGEKSS